MSEHYLNFQLVLEPHSPLSEDAATSSAPSSSVPSSPPEGMNEEDPDRLGSGTSPFAGEAVTEYQPRTKKKKRKKRKEKEEGDEDEEGGRKKVLMTRRPDHGMTTYTRVTNEKRGRIKRKRKQRVQRGRFRVKTGWMD